MPFTFQDTARLEEPETVAENCRALRMRTEAVAGFTLTVTCAGAVTVTILSRR
jgi:hypothetical protein